MPIPPDHQELLNSLQAKLGRGVAPPFADISDSANMSTFVGGSAIAAEIAGYFEMAVGAGIDTSWANVTAHDVRNMLPLIVYQHSVWMRALPLAQHGHSNLLAHILRDLDASSPPGTSIYVGHDRSPPLHRLPPACRTRNLTLRLSNTAFVQYCFSDIDGLAEMLGIAWHSDPMPNNHTAPGCMLRFDVHDAGPQPSVSVSFTYSDVTSLDPSPSVLDGAAYFTDSLLASKVSMQRYLMTQLALVLLSCY